MAEGRMSYKYQRLREKLRQAVVSGELSGKLPGERALAKRFHVNAKTLSKALTDLAAEGILDRSIGRGTYVKGAAPVPAAAAGRWLVICDADGGETLSRLLEDIRRANPDVHVIKSASVTGMRPSFLSGFGAVIDAAQDTPEGFLRDLVVRNLPVVVVNREPKTYSTHAVLADAALGAARLARDLMIAGHRRLAAVEAPGSTTVSNAMRQAARRYERDAVVETCSLADIEHGRGISAVIDAGVTALVCDSSDCARRTRFALSRHGIDVPGRLSLAAVGSLCGAEAAPCTGYFVDCGPLAEAVVSLLRGPGSGRPTTLWLAGEPVEQGTTGPAAGPGDGDRAGASVLTFGDAVG